MTCLPCNADLLSAVKQHKPDVILIDIDAPGRDTLESLQSVQANIPRPMVMFSQDDDNQTIRRATQAGVSAYVVDGLNIGRIRPIIDAAVARFQHFNLLESELKRAHNQRAERKLIDKAKGIIMRQRGVSEEVAYQSMRKLAMETNQKIVQAAWSVLHAAEILGN